jgi:peptide-methionine (S)-S-oxide reductase
MRRSFVRLVLALLALAAAGAAPAVAAVRTETAIFAGGCFWCTEADFDKLPGVIDVVSGYTGGTEANPTYEQVSSERTGHVEAVRVTYDPTKISYRRLVDHFWKTIDPTDAGGQFCDRGPSYHTAVFVNSPAQRREAEASRAAVDKGPLKGKIVTPIRDATRFWPAEGYHQDFHTRSALRYRIYRQGCGRDGRLRQIWGRG